MPMVIKISIKVNPFDSAESFIIFYDNYPAENSSKTILITENIINTNENSAVAT